jgi:serine/threonine protein phosphatase PrpC
MMASVSIPRLSQVFDIINNESRYLGPTRQGHIPTLDETPETYSACAVADSLIYPTIEDDAAVFKLAWSDGVIGLDQVSEDSIRRFLTSELTLSQLKDIYPYVNPFYRIARQLTMRLAPYYEKLGFTFHYFTFVKTNSSLYRASVGDLPLRPELFYLGVHPSLEAEIRTNGKLLRVDKGSYNTGSTLGWSRQALREALSVTDRKLHRYQLCRQYLERFGTMAEKTSRVFDKPIYVVDPTGATQVISWSLDDQKFLYIDRRVWMPSTFLENYLRIFADRHQYPPELFVAIARRLGLWVNTSDIDQICRTINRAIRYLAERYAIEMAEPPPAPTIFTSVGKPDSRSIIIESDIGGHIWNAVKKVAAGYTTGPRRPTMEDEHIAIDNFDNQRHEAFFGVFDGHGGRLAARYAVEHLADKYAQLRDWAQTYRAIDEEICQQERIKGDGTTAVTVIVTQGTISCANAGDSRAIYIENGVGVRLSQDHKPGLPSEKQRIESVGGLVSEITSTPRVNGILAVSRSLGDARLKTCVISDPYVVNIPRNSNITHLVLACDGVWDVLSDQEVTEIVMANQLDLDMACRHIMRRSLPSTDNISVIVVKL